MVIFWYAYEMLKDVREMFKDVQKGSNGLFPEQDILYSLVRKMLSCLIR